MTRPCPADPVPCRRGWTFVVLPAAAFGLGMIAAVGVAKSRGEPVRGVYRQEVVAVPATASGRIVSLDLRHGSEVVPGRRLATIEDAASAERIDSLKSEKEHLARELAVAEGKAAVEVALRTEAFEKERLDTRLRYADLLRARLDVRVRRKALEESGGGSAGAIRQASTASASSVRLRLAEAANEEEVLDAQVALCEDRLAEIERSLAELPAKIGGAMGIDRLRADIAALDARLSEAAEKETAVVVDSPAHGRVGVYRRKSGDVVVAGETLVEIFDSERPYVLVTVPLAEVRSFEPGRRVRVEFVGLPTHKPLQGTVADVFSDAERDADLAVVPDAAAAQIRVVPTGRLWPVPPPGTTAIVTPEG